MTLERSALEAIAEAAAECSRRADALPLGAEGDYERGRLLYGLLGAVEGACSLALGRDSKIS